MSAGILDVKYAHSRVPAGKPNSGECLVKYLLFLSKICSRQPTKAIDTTYNDGKAQGEL